MKVENLFTEKQRFNQWWLWLLLIVVNGLVLYNFYKYAITGNIENTAFSFLVGIPFFIPLLVSFLLLSFRLDTTINEEGIYVRFFPLQIKMKYYPWNEIANCFVREYSPIGEYGGWGMRGFGKNRALNISGNKGLQIEFTDQKRLLIGTNKPDELKSVIAGIEMIRNKN